MFQRKDRKIRRLIKGDFLAFWDIFKPPEFVGLLTHCLDHFDRSPRETRFSQTSGFP